MAVEQIFRLKRGLDIPIEGNPEQTIDLAAQPRHVAIIATDYVGLRPTMAVSEGDSVLRGQLLFEDKKNAGARLTAPGAGEVVGIHRGDRRVLQSVVIALNERERAGDFVEEDEVAFQAFSGKDVAGLSADDIRALLIESGLWAAFRTRPFSRIPEAESSPHSIFVTAMDTRPLAPSPEVVLEGREGDFERGLIAIAKLTDGPTYLCKKAGSSISTSPNIGVTQVEFEGPHPAGTPGVHIHFLDPVHRDKTVWHVGYQDVMTIGKLIESGRLDVTRVISLAGPLVKRPRLLKTRLGASLDDLVLDELEDTPPRIISGSVLSGRKASGEVHGYLGRYDNQVSVIQEGADREFMGWGRAGKNKFSLLRLYTASLRPDKQFRFTSATNGSKRAMVPMGSYERVMPMDIIPTHLLRALAVGNVEQAEMLGCLELDEEDLALCTFVCPSKIEYGPLLRSNLDTIEKEG